ncbi:hypothetical protein [Streptomyces sp. NPDC006784]|uniref:hypothetical protein n=1 Tax=Streptomyces sp. NPDC006784 TaxID=3364764 RepID=UPI00368BF17F
MPRQKTGETPKRNIRVPNEVWDPAKTRATQEGRTIAAVVNSYLSRYGSGTSEGAATANPWDIVNLVMRELPDKTVGPETDLANAVDAAADMLRALGIAPVVKPRPDE